MEIVFFSNLICCLLFLFFCFSQIESHLGSFATLNCHPDVSASNLSCLSNDYGDFGHGLNV